MTLRISAPKNTACCRCIASAASDAALAASLAAASTARTSQLRRSASDRSAVFALSAAESLSVASRCSPT